MRKVVVDELSVPGTIQGKNNLLPPTQCNSLLTDCDEGERKRVRRVLFKYSTWNLKNKDEICHHCL